MAERGGLPGDVSLHGSGDARWRVFLAISADARRSMTIHAVGDGERVRCVGFEKNVTPRWFAGSDCVSRVKR